MGKFPRRREYTNTVGKLEKFVEKGASSVAHSFRAIAGMTSGSLDLEALS